MVCLPYCFLFITKKTELSSSVFFLKHLLSVDTLLDFSLNKFVKLNFLFYFCRIIQRTDLNNHTCAIMPTITFELSEQDIMALLKNEELTLTLRQNQITTDSEQENKSEKRSFFAYFEQNIELHKNNAKMRTAETYRTALNSLKRFSGDKPLSISEITPPLMRQYERYMLEKGLSKNSTSFYMRITRAVYNRCVDGGLTADTHPFRHVYTGVAKTEKRALGMKSIRAIQRLQLPPSPQAFARDMFLFSFYTRGMSFVDIAYLKKRDVSGGFLTYQRKKTGQSLTIRWEPAMQKIVDRYPSANDFLFPIIKDSGQKARSQYRNMLYQVNTQLAEIGRKVGAEVKLTMYVARHSWASIALQMNIPMDVISRGMGHESEKTTRIYLKSLNNSQLDTANSQIIRALKE